MSDKVKEQMLMMDEQLKIPFTFSYTDGYNRYFSMITTLGLLCAFVIAICTAPLFSREYTSKTDQIILSTKYGKNRVIAVKLFTGFSFTILFGLVHLVLAYVLSLFVFGADGGNAPIQFEMLESPYTLTMAQASLILTIVSLFAYLMTCAITMLLSAKLKSPFGVIVLVSILLILPMLGYASEQNILIYNLYHLLPTQMTSFATALDIIQYEIGGLMIHPYVMFPIVAGLVSIVLTPFAYQSFKKHQIG